MHIHALCPLFNNQCFWNTTASWKHISNTFVVFTVTKVLKDWITKPSAQTFLIKKIHISFYCVSKQEGDSLNVEYGLCGNLLICSQMCEGLSGETAQLSGNDTVVRRAILSLFHPVLMFFHDMILTGRTDEIWCLSFQISRILDFEHVSVKCLMQMPPSVTCVCTGSLFFQLI